MLATTALDDEALASVSADGADDNKACRTAIAQRGAQAVIPRARFKRLGERIMACTFARQVAGLQGRLVLLNRFTQRGRPTTVTAMASLRLG